MPLPPTPTKPLSPNLPVPHSGYHWDGSARRFFEGWYLRLTLPELDESVAFMYSIEDPIGGKTHSGGTAQILGFGEQYRWRTFPDVQQFWAWRHRFGLGHWRSAIAHPSTQQTPRYLDPETFDHTIHEGYQATANLHQGTLRDPISGKSVRWCYTIEPWDGWGDRTELPRATAGWLSFLPVFEPGWQVLMAHGHASGWIDWEGDRHTFTNAPAYAEKNWGGAFPEKWFWIQCNAFDAEPDLSVTAVGSWREVLTWREKVGMVGIHYRGTFYEFPPRNGKLAWKVAPWGSWQVVAETKDLRVELVGTCDRPSADIRVPSTEGMVFGCKDTTHGTLTLTLWQGQQRLIQATSHQAGLEVGGHPWKEVWEFGDAMMSADNR